MRVHLLFQSVVAILGVVLAAMPVAAEVTVAAVDPAAAEVRAAVDPAAVRTIGEMMRSLARESRADAARIEQVYGDAARRAGLRDREALARSLADGSIAPVPSETDRFNLAPRLGGRHPIGEKDLEHQALYVAARPATLGLLLHVAARVRSTPLEVTSLVRHHEYQRALQRTNPNARTTVPTHALGLAFDVSVLHATPESAAEIRDVLRQMRDEGVLFFIAEQRQLVFHVVPAPPMMAFYEALYHGLTGVPAATLAVRPALPLEVSRPPDPDLMSPDAYAAGGFPSTALASALLGALAASGASLGRRISSRRASRLSLRS